MFQPSTTNQDFTFKAVRLPTSILCSTEIIKSEGCSDVFSGGFYRCSSSLQCVGKKEHNFRENIDFKIQYQQKIGIPCMETKLNK